MLHSHLTDVVTIVVVLAPALSMLAFVVLSIVGLLGPMPSERLTRTITISALLGSFVAALLVFVTLAERHWAPLHIPLGIWFSTPHYKFHLAFHLDLYSSTMLLLTTVVTLLAAKFSGTYLHREPGFTRFFMLLSIFSTGMQLLVLAGTFDLLFVGWELVGLSSVLLVAFYNDRIAPLKASLRIFIIYRLCDLGLLVGNSFLHRAGHGPEIGDLHAEMISPFWATVIGLCFLLATIGKSAQFPLGGWLPRAMEGPTSSSALFYGALSVHAGVYLLLRAGPVLDRSMIASSAIAVVGLSTAFMGTLCWRVQADVKSELAFATMTQVGLMVAEIGLGFRRFVLLHLVAHACLRTYQLLRSPSALADVNAIRFAQDAVSRRGAGPFIDHLPKTWRHALYRLAWERFQLDVFESTITAPVNRLTQVLAKQEERFTHFVDDQLAKKIQQVGAKKDLMGAAQSPEDRQR